MHDPGHLLFRRALRVAIVLPLAYLLTEYVLKMPYGSTYTVFGTFVLLSFADFGGPTRDRARAYIVTGLAGLVAIILGTFAALNPIAAVVCTFIVGAGPRTRPAAWLRSHSNNGNPAAVCYRRCRGRA